MRHWVNTEVEGKITIESVTNLKAVDEDIACLLNSEVHSIEEWYLDTPFSSLRKNDHLLRVRLKRGVHITVTELSWKGPKKDPVLDTRDDVSVELKDDPVRGLLYLFGKLGYQPIIKIEKQRREVQVGEFEYELDDSVVIFDLQRNKSYNLGTYLSICITVPSESSAQRLMEARRKVIERLRELSCLGKIESRTFGDILEAADGG